MAVSNRLRYEILRRDNHACRYCGAMAPEARLEVDHVVPVALGGADTADNLVAACASCNSGKSSTTADAELVMDVAQDALRWRRAIEAANEMAARERATTQDYIDQFHEEWISWTRSDGNGGRVAFDLPGGWQQKVREFAMSGLPVSEVCEAVDIAFSSPSVNDEFAYFLGICRQKVSQMQRIAAELIHRGVVD